MARRVQERIDDSFPDDAASDAKEFAEKIFNTWKDVSVSLARIATLILVLIAVFELLAYQQSKSFSIGPFSFANTSIVQTFLPVVIAYLMYEAHILTYRWNGLQQAYITITWIYAPKVRSNDLDIFIQPHLPSIWGIGSKMSRENELRSERFDRIVRLTIAVTVAFLLPLIFETQAYYRLFGEYGYRNVIVWVSAGLSATIIAVLMVSFILTSELSDIPESEWNDLSGRGGPTGEATVTVEASVAPAPPETPTEGSTGESEWSVRPLNTGGDTIDLLIQLSYESHTLQVKMDSWKCQILLDEKTIIKIFDIRGKHTFSISDGQQSRTASLLVDSTSWGTIRRMKLTVDNRVLYEERPK
jgi:hypothetical protein